MMRKVSLETILTALFSVGAVFAFFCSVSLGGPMNSAFTFLFVASFILFRTYTKKLHAYESKVERILGITLDSSRTDSSDKFLHELALLKRRGDALIPELIEGTIQGAPELSRALNRIVEIAIRQLGGESAELALFDKEDGRYHSSIVVGKPFRLSIDEYLSGKFNTSSRNIHVEPISFAGTVLGALRVAQKDGQLNHDTKGVLKILSLQAAVAIVNANFLTELLKMKELSHASQKAKTGFLANLSHELRGPLGIVLNASELLREEVCGPLTADQKDTLGMIQKNGAHLLELLNDVLDYAKIESGKISTHPVAIASKELFVDLAAVVRAQADMKQHKIHIDDLTDATFFCDRRHIRQILINLLTNAIKYTPDGGEIRLWAESVRGGKVKLCIKDSGIGISQGDREKVFSAFERIDNAYSRKQIGTGLGMPLSKRLAEINHGTIDFDSTPGKGSVFWITLPAADEAVTGTEIQEAESAVSGEGRALLFISSATEEQCFTTRYLKERGFGVTVAGTIDEALREVQATRYSAVLIDDSALIEYEQNPISSFRDEILGFSTPIILISSDAFVFNVQDQLRAGVDRHITKPVSLREVAKVCLEVSKSDERLVHSDDKTNAGPIVH